MNLNSAVSSSLKCINIIALLGGASVSCAQPNTQSSVEQPKNVLLILVDDLKPTLGCYGDPIAVSPNIDRLAGLGIRFNNAYCNQAVCMASRYNLLTGARSTSTGLYNFGSEFRDIYPDAITLPQYFMNAGYHTEAIGKVFHVGHGNTDDKVSWSIPLHHEKMIEYILPESTNRQLTREEVFFENTRLYFDDVPPMRELPRGAAWEIADVLDEAYADGRIARRAIDRLRVHNANPEQPFFMAVGFMRPHLPFVPPKKYWDMYDPEKLPMPEFEQDPENAPPMAIKRGGEIEQFDKIPIGQHIFPDSIKRKLIHGYYASVSYVDAQVGRVVNELERLGMLDNTIVILWSDHGWHLGDHGYWTKHTLYEQANVIPLIMVVSGVTTPGTATDQIIETVDIYPTLTNLAGLGFPEAPQPIDGLSMVPVLKNPSLEIRDHAYHSFTRGGYIGRAIRTDRYRLVEWVRINNQDEERFYELYDYLTDPLETRNVYDEHPEVVASLMSILARHPQAENPAPRSR